MAQQERPLWKSPIILIGGPILAIWAGTNAYDKCTQEPSVPINPITQPANPETAKKLVLEGEEAKRLYEKWLQETKTPVLQQDYSKLLDQTLKNLPSQIKEPNLVTPYPYGYLNSDQGNFVNTFEAYLLRGEKFRRSIEYAKAKGLTSEQLLLETAYQYWQNFAKGQEFFGNGLLKKETQFSAGMVIRINDWDKRSPGIFLRPQPIPNIDPKWPAVYNGTVVKIEEGPVLVIDDTKLEAFPMWQVQVGTLVLERNFVVRVFDSKGWIAQEWLGEKAQN